MTKKHLTSAMTQKLDLNGMKYWYLYPFHNRHFASFDGKCASHFIQPLSCEKRIIQERMIENVD